MKNTHPSKKEKKKKRQKSSQVVIYFERERERVDSVKVYKLLWYFAAHKIK